MRIANSLLWLAALLTWACSRPAAPPAATVDVSFCVREEATKVTGAGEEQESALSHWAVFVFETGGSWFRYACSADGLPLRLSLKQGVRYDCLAVANYPLSGAGKLDPSLISSADALRSFTARLEDNAPDSFLMYGECSLVPVSPAAQQEIPVRRLVTRLEVRGVGVDFSTWPAWAGETLLLRHIYVTNAYKTTAYGEDLLSVSPDRSAWYNTLGWHGGSDVSPALDLLLSDRSLNVTLDATHPYNAVHRFYLYPNPVEEDSRNTASWTPRRTRLVVEAEVAGTVYYYPADVPPLRRNQLCTAGRMVIRGPGSSVPEGETLTSNIFSVDWDHVEKITLE